MPSPQKVLVLYSDLELDISKVVKEDSIKVTKLWGHQVNTESFDKLEGVVIIDGIFNQDVSLINKVMAEASSNSSIKVIAFAGVPPRKFSHEEHRLISIEKDARLKEIIAGRDLYILDNALQILLSFDKNDYMLLDTGQLKPINAFFDEKKVVFEKLEDYLYAHFGLTAYQNYIKLKTAEFTKAFGRGKAGKGYFTIEELNGYAAGLYLESTEYCKSLGINFKEAKVINSFGSPVKSDINLNLEILLEF